MSDKKPVNSSIRIVTDNHTFMINSIAGNLEKIGIAACITDTPTYLNAEVILPEYIFLQAEDFAEDSTGVFDEILKKSAEHGAKVIIMGYEGTIDNLKNKSEHYYVVSELHRPLDVNAACEKLKKIVNEVHEHHYEAKKKIMAIDDSGAMLRTILSWLEDEYEVTLVNSAAKALILLHTMKPDLILLDYEMPVLSGAGLFAKIKEDIRVRSVPVIFLTSKDDVETVKEVLSLKPAGYIIKTNTGEQVKRKIKEIIG